MQNLDNCGLLVNGKPLSWYGGAAMLDYSVGETEISAETFQGVNRTSWALLKSFFGRRTLNITILFKGHDLHAVKLQRSKLNGQLFGRVELFISDDGFYYDAICTSLGAEEYGGQGEQEAQIKSTYAFYGIRRDALASVTVPAGGSMFCRSTMPLTDCRLTATVSDSDTVTGNPVTVNNTAGKTITDLFSAITPSASGVSAITIQQSNGTETSSTPVPLGKTVYGGSVDATGGELTETYAGGAYDPANIPAALDALIISATAEESATAGAIASFECELGEYPLSGLSVSVEPVQAGSGDPSPDNVRPISGWDSVVVNRKGKNLFDPNANPGKYLNATGGLSSHEGAATSDYIRIPAVAGQVVNLSTQISGTKHICVYSEDKSFIRRVYNGGVGEQLSTTSLTLTQEDVAAGAAFIRASTYSEADRMLTFGEPAAYEPYSGNTYTIALGETVYGGTLDVVNGTMMVDKVAVTIDGSTVMATGYATFDENKRFVIPYPSGEIARYTGADTFCLSDKLNPSYWGVISDPDETTDIRCFSHSGGILVTFPGSTGISTTAAANEWFAANTPTVCYELATPVELTLTPQQIATLQGENNVWSDAGEISALAYRDGNIAEISILTQSGALVSGESVAYPLATPAASSITPITAPALLSGNSTISGSSGTLTVTVAKELPNPYPLGGATFANVAAGDVLVFDGITGAITRNGQPDAANVNWTSFPSLTPGENENDAPDAVTVEYYPTYI